MTMDRAQVLLNLINNAVKYTPASEDAKCNSITIKVCLAPPMLCTCVS